MVKSLLLTQTTDDQPLATMALGCLVFIGRRYGVPLTVEGLRQDNRLAGPEVTFAQLLICAEAAGFRCRSLHIKWTGILELKKALPAIVRLEDGRTFVLLRLEEQVGAMTVVLQDPGAADGTPLVMTRSAFEEVWRGELILIKRSQQGATSTTPFGLEVMWGLLVHQRALLRDLAISVAGLTLLAMVPLLFAQLLISYVLAYPASVTFIFLCLGFVLLVLFEAGFLALRGSIVNRLAIRFEHDLAGHVVERLLSLPLDYFETTPQGLIAHKLDKIATVRSVLTGRLVGGALDAGLLALFVPMMLYYSPLLTFIAGAFGVAIVGWTLFMLPKYRLRAAAIEAAEAERSAFVSESVAGVRTIKSLALGARQRHKWDVLTARVARLRLAEGDAANTLETTVMPLERMMVFGTFAIGVYLAYSTDTGLSIGMLFGYLLLLRRVADPFSRLAALVRDYDEAKTAVAAIGSLVDQPVEDGRSGRGVRLALRGQIEFSNVRFAYSGTSTPALQSISFDVPKGTTLGIMGRSGSGKTTITRLLQKLHSDYQGLIKIDGIDAREYDLDHLRGSLGVVLQDSFLFSGTIRDNIAIAKPDASEEEVVFAARLAGAEEFIDKLPQGYATTIHEGSPNLSDGQRQRIAIARALITDPQILIFDEATSALDAESEAIVNANLKRIASGRTMITISHRLSALVNADAILVLDRGEVQDIGRHSELLERCDIYSGQWQRQTMQIETTASPEKMLPRNANVA